MSLSAITLSGWGQPTESLQEILPGARAMDYARHLQVPKALEAISETKNPDIVIGWSLGGQMAVRAIAGGLLKPKKLVLIASPFQFVARPDRKLGMPADLYHTFRDNYAANPGRTLVKAWASIVKGDQNAAAIRHQLEQQDKPALLQKDWLGWLDVLQSFSCAGLFIADFPPTLLIHGREDAVVYHEQSVVFADSIPHAKLLTLEGCGHAPHWHNPARVKQAIRDFAHV